MMTKFFMWNSKIPTERRSILPNQSKLGLPDGPASSLSCSPSRFDRSRSLVPGHSALAEIRFVRHVARQRSMMPEYDVLRDRLAASDSLEIIPKMRFDVVPRRPRVTCALHFRGRICDVVIRVPLLEVLIAQRLGKAVRVIAG